MSEENQECPKCNSKTVRHDRVKGNVKCFECRRIVESHYQTYEQEVNNYENDPDQMNKMRGFVQDGKDVKLKIGKEIIDGQPRKKRKVEEDNSQMANQLLRDQCNKCYEFDDKNIHYISIYYYILLNMDQQRNQAQANTLNGISGTTSGTAPSSSIAQKETGENILKRKAVLAIFIFLKSMKMTDDDPKNTLKKICNSTCVSYDEVNDLISKVKKDQFKDKDKIADILFKQDLLTFAEQYSKKANLSEKDNKGYLALCQQIKDSDISNGEQFPTKAAAALYVVFKLSNNPEHANKGLKELHNISDKSEGTIKKFYDGTLSINIVSLLESIKYQQYNWKHYSELKKD